MPLGAVTALRAQDDPPAVVLETDETDETDTMDTTVGHLGRRRDAFRDGVARRLEAQRQLLEDLTGQPGFSDGRGVPRAAIEGFDDLLARSTAPGRAPCAGALVAAATGEPRLGFVRLLDPDPQGMQAPTALPESWAVFLLVPVAGLTALEILAGTSAATYVFREVIEAVNRDLQMLHCRRAPLALTPEQAEVNEFQRGLSCVEIRWEVRGQHQEWLKLGSGQDDYSAIVRHDENAGGESELSVGQCA